MHIDQREILLIEVNVKGLCVAKVHPFNKAQPRNLRSCRLTYLFCFDFCDFDLMVVPDPLGADKGEREFRVKRRDGDIEPVDLLRTPVLKFDRIGRGLQERGAVLFGILGAPGKKIQDAL